MASSGFHRLCFKLAEKIRSQRGAAAQFRVVTTFVMINLQPGVYSNSRDFRDEGRTEWEIFEHEVEVSLYF